MLFAVEADSLRITLQVISHCFLNCFDQWFSMAPMCSYSLMIHKTVWILVVLVKCPQTCKLVCKRRNLSVKDIHRLSKQSLMSWYCHDRNGTVYARHEQLWSFDRSSILHENILTFLRLCGCWFGWKNFLQSGIHFLSVCYHKWLVIFVIEELQSRNICCLMLLCQLVEELKNLHLDWNTFR